MALHEKFNFDTLESLEEKAAELGLNLSFSRDLSPLAKPVRVHGKTATAKATAPQAHSQSGAICALHRVAMD